MKPPKYGFKIFDNNGSIHYQILNYEKPFTNCYGKKTFEIVSSISFEPTRENLFLGDKKIEEGMQHLFIDFINKVIPSSCVPPRVTPEASEPLASADLEPPQNNNQ